MAFKDTFNDPDLEIPPSVCDTMGFENQKLMISEHASMSWIVDDKFLRDVKAKAERFVLKWESSRVRIVLKTPPITNQLTRGTSLPTSDINMWEYGDLVAKIHGVIKDDQCVKALQGSSSRQGWYYPSGIVYLVDGNVAKFESMAKNVYQPTYQRKTTIKFDVQGKKFNDELVHYWKFQATSWVGTGSATVWYGQLTFADVIDFLTGAMIYREDDVKFIRFVGEGGQETITKEHPWDQGFQCDVDNDSTLEIKSEIPILLDTVCRFIGGLFLEFQPECFSERHLLMEGRQQIVVRPLKVGDICMGIKDKPDKRTYFNELEMRPLRYEVGRICPEFED